MPLITLLNPLLWLNNNSVMTHSILIGKFQTINSFLTTLKITENKIFKWCSIEFRFLWMSCRLWGADFLYFQKRAFPLHSDINNLFFHWTQTTWKPAQEKNLFSPIIFLLLDTFTQYNFKMPTSYFFQLGNFFSPLWFSLGLWDIFLSIARD